MKKYSVIRNESTNAIFIIGGHATQSHVDMYFSRKDKFTLIQLAEGHPVSDKNTPLTRREDKVSPFDIVTQVNGELVSIVSVEDYEA